MSPLGSPTIVPFAFRVHTHDLGKLFVLLDLFTSAAAASCAKTS